MCNWILIITLSVLALGGAVFFLWRRDQSIARQAYSLLTQTMHVHPYHACHERLEAELSRARRFQHPLCVAVFRFHPNAAERNGNGGSSAKSPAASNGHGKLSLAQQLTFLMSGSILRDALRAHDLVAYDGVANQYVVLLVEVNKQQAQRTMRRLRRLVANRTGLLLRAGIAEFPAEGYIIEDLVKNARLACGKPGFSRPSPLVREEENGNSAGNFENGRPADASLEPPCEILQAHTLTES